uniref:Uncharacterized protein n=1 Tax=Bionectria ochroleuca TaxID=29856 RepID=A0A8H7KAZ4_BIOOC
MKNQYSDKRPNPILSANCYSTSRYKPDGGRPHQVFSMLVRSRHAKLAAVLDSPEQLAPTYRFDSDRDLMRYQTNNIYDQPTSQPPFKPSRPNQTDPAVTLEPTSHAHELHPLNCFF